MKFRLGLENHVPRSYRITLKSCISSVKKFLTWPKKDADINKNYQTLKPISIFSKTAFSLRVRNHKRNPSGRELGYIKSFDICIIFQLTILQGKTTWTFQYNIFFKKRKKPGCFWSLFTKPIEVSQCSCPILRLEIFEHGEPSIDQKMKSYFFQQILL